MQIITNVFLIIFARRGEITQVTVSNRYDGFVEAFGQVTRFVGDENNNFLAKKYALTKALENSNLDRVDRTEIWENVLRYI